MLETGEISIHDDRWLTYPWGVNGGEPGTRSTKKLVRKDGTVENIPSKCDRVAVSPGDILYFNTWGGGGWGDPLKRDPLLVLTDMRRGLVTEEGRKALRRRDQGRQGGRRGDRAPARRHGIAAQAGRLVQPRLQLDRGAQGPLQG